MNKGARIVEKAKELGVAMAGIANIEQLKKSPSHEILKKFGTKIDGVCAVAGINRLSPVEWPPEAKSVLVIAVSHPQNNPRLDWFYTSGNTPGNQILIRINRELSKWIEETLGIKTHKMPYYVERGGIYLKDAAVLGGLGCIGKNNMLITPELGPRVRLRALLLETGLASTGPIDFDPCRDCGEFCRRACPQKAFDNPTHSPGELGITELPARDGHFSRARCTTQMDKDVESFEIDIDLKTLAGLDKEEVRQGEKPIKHCRKCEFACPVGTSRHTSEKALL
ncbi:iron-sulfur cluster-binding protein [Desulfocucumis palustris]|uniref:Iron-sulfur cluster-binding protein n=1 Tax=Desulfocucumis palustris TaxID=1898651 RepID=A0A2L2XBI6_9FIRM|nr:Fe-S protein [Desulfocucumis palustris]GBF33575.1 iron-sulfur cluster-binding protein [Desulfocucumis palustris]